MATSNSFGARVLRFVSRLLKSMWLFFPGILFLLFTIFVFWSLGQGKDIIVAFTENQSRTIFSINYTRVIFFLAIGFWVYVSWYSSRINAYIKKSKQEDEIQDIAGVDRATADKAFDEKKPWLEISKSFLDLFPRVIGNGCFLVLELAVLQSPLLEKPLSAGWAWIILIAALVLLRYLNRLLEKAAVRPGFRRMFWIWVCIFIVALVVGSMFKKISILALLGLLVLLHIVFVYYINLRRIGLLAAPDLTANKKERRGLLTRLMDYFCVPRKESGYFRWYLYIGILGLVFYCLAINSSYFARGIGPFPFIILGFSVLLAFGNIVTAFSVKYSINFHFILVIIAFLLGFGETHYVKTVKLESSNHYDTRPQLKTYLPAWLNDRNVTADSSADGYDVYFVMANGGASRSGYWTAAVLGKIEDATLAFDSTIRFSDRVFCLSGTSGGGVGVATFFSLLRDKETRRKPVYNSSSRDFLKEDYFTYTFARMLGPDYFNYIFHIGSDNDRAAALEMSFEKTSLNYDDSLYQVPFYDTMSKFPAMKNGKVYLPILCVNTTRMQDGNPGVVTNLRLDSNIFNNRVDVLKLLGKTEDITITTASILGARFPYLSPAGRIADDYFVDGGYFDNSGAGVVQEMIRGIINIGLQDSIDNGASSPLYRQIKKLHFKILHITNSPVNMAANIQPVAPIRNDLMAPLLTIVGAYDMQTTVNDSRLINFIRDVNTYSGFKADYIQIPLYKEMNEWMTDPLREKNATEPSYAMNWFMSDTTLHRINKRLLNHPKLDSLIRSYR